MHALTPLRSSTSRENCGLDCGYHALINWALNQTRLKSLWWWKCVEKMHHNEARPVNCDGGRSSMKVQNQVRVWPVGQHTSSWHITDMWDRSVSKPISIDSKMANPLFLERDEEREHTDVLARRPRYIWAWLVDWYHSFHVDVGLPFSALLRNKHVLF